MAKAGEIGAKTGAADILEAGAKRLRCNIPDHRLQRGDQPLTIGLPERDETRAGGNPVRELRMEEAVQQLRQRDLMRRADDAMYRAKRSRRELVPELAGGEQPLPELVHDHALVGGVEAVAGEADAEEEDRGVEDAPERLLGP